MRLDAKSFDSAKSISIDYAVMEKTSDGVVVPLRLTHAVLSDLVAARRPTVTSALSELGKRGLLRPVDEGWLLSGDPPAPVDADGAANGAGMGHRS